MKNIYSFLRTTIIGGLFFIAPIVLLIIIIGKALDIFRALVAPIADHLPFEHIGGIAVTRIIAFFILILLCLIAGLLIKSKQAKNIIQWIEIKVLNNVPGYTLIKTMSENLAGMESNEAKPVVMVDMEEAWQIGILMEELNNGLNVVYIPGSPSPFSGEILYVKDDRVKKIDVNEVNAMQIYHNMGVGSKKILDGKIDSSLFIYHPKK